MTVETCIAPEALKQHLVACLHGGGREGGDVSHGVHGEVGADGVADNDEYMLWMLKDAIYV